MCSTVIHSPGLAFQECTGSCYENVPAPKAVSSLYDVNTWSDCIGYRIEIVCLIATINHPTYNTSQTQWNQWPTTTRRWCCETYPAGNVDISRYLAIPGSPRVTILLANSVRKLVYCLVKHSSSPDFKFSSNVSHPFVWITGPATDPSLRKRKYKAKVLPDLMIEDICLSCYQNSKWMYSIIVLRLTQLQHT